MEQWNLSTIRERYPKLLISGIGVLIAIIILVLGYQYLDSLTPPQLQSTDPTNGATKVDPFGTVTITFNRNLSIKDSTRFSITPTLVGTPKVYGKSLTFTPNGYFAIGTTYTVALTNPISDSGIIGKSVTFSFTIKDQNNLSLDDKNKIQSQSDYLWKQEIDQASQTTDYKKGVALFNLVQATPYDNGTFSVAYSRQTNSFTVTIEQNPYSSSKQAAIAWIKAQGVDDLSWITVNFVAGNGVNPGS